MTFDEITEYRFFTAWEQAALTKWQNLNIGGRLSDNLTVSGILVFPSKYFLTSCINVVFFHSIISNATNETKYCKISLQIGEFE